MDKRHKKIVKIYLKDGRYQKEDYDRLADKAVKNLTGEYINSEVTTIASRYVVPGYQKQERQYKSDAGSKPKRNEAVWQATIKLLKKNHDATPRQAWNTLKGDDMDEWVLEIVDDLLFTTYEGRDPVQKRRKNPPPLKFDTYRTEYVYKVRKALGITVK